MKKMIVTASLYTVITAVLLGIVYPVAMTAIAHLAFRQQADGSLLYREGKLIGSHLLGQPFTGDAVFHSRPSAAGSGYDASASSGSNYGPTNQALADRVTASVKGEGNDAAVPIDLVTASASGLDPDITPAAALYQVDRVARARHADPQAIRALVLQHIQPRQFGLLGEPRVNVLELNLALQKEAPSHP